MRHRPVPNLDFWDERALLHGQDDYYDVEAFRAGGSTLRERELTEVAAALGPIEGLDVLHLQCHFGLDSLSWARRGARVTGVDFSPVAVARARALAGEVGLDATFVQADVVDLPGSLSGRFDLVFASYGVFCWIRDVDAWMRSAAVALRSGGKLVAVDIHPLCQMIDTVEPLVTDFPYQGAEPQPFESSGSYAARKMRTSHNRTVQYPHGIGELTTGAARAGLRVEALTEWLDSDRDDRGDVLTHCDDGRWRLPFGAHWLPVAFALRAARLP